MERNKYKNNKSGYKGVCLDKTSYLWKVQRTINGKNIYLGKYKSKETAIEVARRAFSII